MPRTLSPAQTARLADAIGLLRDLVARGEAGPFAEEIDIVLKALNDLSARIYRTIDGLQGLEEE